MTQVRMAVDAENILGEGVLWCERTRRVLWTDIHGAKLWCLVPDTGQVQSWSMPDRVGSFALTQDDDTLLLGLASALAFFHLETGTLTPICEVEPELASTRINDGRCDRQGRFVFGTLNEDPSRERIGSFYRIGPDLRLERLPLGGVAIPNSICFSPDGARMYYCDSLSKRIRCCDYGPSSLEFAGDKVFVDLASSAGEPDGSTIDADGYLWNAQWGASRVVRFSPEGDIERVVPVPASQPSCVAFGGTGLSTLFITTARAGLAEGVLERDRFAGSLFSVELRDVRGLPECRFAGAPQAQ